MNLTTFYGAVQLLKPFVDATTRVLNVPIVYKPLDGLYAFNGQLFGKIDGMFSFDREWAVNGADLVSVLKEKSKVTVDSADARMVIQNGKSKFKLPLMSMENVVHTKDMPTVEYWKNIAIADIEAINLAMKFAGKNTMHPWAYSVTLNGMYSFATNNLCLVCIRMAHKYHDEPLTLPLWVIPMLQEGIQIAVVDNVLCFKTEDGVQGFGLFLEQGPPPALLQYGNELTKLFEHEWEDISTCLEAYNDINVMDMRRFTIQGSTMSSTNQDKGTTAESEIDWDVELEKPVCVLSDTAELIFKYATALNFDESPKKVYFMNTNPMMVGVATTVSVGE